MIPRDGKNRIAKALVALLQKRSLEDITVKELVAAAAVSRPTFYYHFGALEDVIHYIMESFLESAREAAMSSMGLPADLGREWAEGTNSATIFYTHVYENRDVFCAIVNSPYRESFYERLADSFVEQLRHAPHLWRGDDGELTPMRMRNRGYWDRCWTYLTIGAVEQWRLRDFEETPEELSELVWELITNVDRFKFSAD